VVHTYYVSPYVVVVVVVVVEVDDVVVGVDDVVHDDTHTDFVDDNHR